MSAFDDTSINDFNKHFGLPVEPGASDPHVTDGNDIAELRKWVAKHVPRWVSVEATLVTLVSRRSFGRIFFELGRRWEREGRQ